MKPIACFASIFLLCILEANAECPATSLSIRDSYFTVSYEEVDAFTAEQICSSSGGTLAKIEDEETMSRFHEMLNNKWNVRNLQRVWQFKKDGYLCRYIKADELPSYGGWILDDELPSFLLYKDSWSMYSTPVWFGHDHQNTKWIVCKDKTIVGHDGNGWHRDFILYGGSENTPGVKKLYKFRKQGVWSTKLSSFNHSDNENLDLVNQVIHVPDFLVFIGARSNVNESNWTWNDGTKVNASLFHQSEAGVCEQMSWHYEDEWKSLSTDCTAASAFYICQYKISVDVASDECNGSVLYLSWNPNLWKGLFSSQTCLKAQVNEKLLSVETVIKTGQLTLAGLQQRKDYHMNVSASLINDCKPFVVSTKVQGTTSYGIPDAVEYAVVDVNVTDACIIEWIHQQEHVTKYEISAYYNHSRMINTMEKSTADVKVGEIIRMSVFSEEFPLHLNITYTLTAASCAGRSQPYPVAGYCVITKNEKADTTHMDVVTIILIGSVGGVLGLLAVARVAFVAYQRRSRQNANTNFNVDEIENASGNCQTPVQQPPVIGVSHQYEAIKEANNAYEDIHIYEIPPFGASGSTN